MPPLSDKNRWSAQSCADAAQTAIEHANSRLSVDGAHLDYHRAEALLKLAMYRRLEEGQA